MSGSLSSSEGAMKSSSSVVFLRFAGRGLSKHMSQRMLRTGMRDREPVFLRFLLSVGDEDEFAASFFLKARTTFSFGFTIDNKSCV
jgi:hypothetical protein